MTTRAIVFDAYGTLYDVQSVARAVAVAFPDHADIITQIWRLKQLEYSWLRSMMGRYADFRQVSRESLDYTLGVLGLTADDATSERLVDGYDWLLPYPEAVAALTALRGDCQLAILSNGSPAMLDALARNSGLDRYLHAVISVDAARAFKPDRRAYELVGERLGVRAEEVLFVTSNGFDVAGAKSFGFRVVRIERVGLGGLAAELRGDAVGPAGMYRALRSQTEALGFQPDGVVDSLLGLTGLLG